MNFVRIRVGTAEGEGAREVGAGLRAVEVRCREDQRAGTVGGVVLDRATTRSVARIVADQHGAIVAGGTGGEVQRAALIGTTKLYLSACAQGAHRPAIGDAGDVEYSTGLGSHQTCKGIQIVRNREVAATDLRKSRSRH